MDDIFKAFIKVFPDTSDILTYRAHGRHALVVFFKTREPIIFTHLSSTDWQIRPYKF